MAKTRRRRGSASARFAAAVATLDLRRLGWRLLLAALIVALAALAFQQALVGVARRASPALALRADGDDPVALTARADALLTSGQTGDIRSIVAPAEEALRGQIALPAAVRLIGIGREAAKRPVEARRLVTLAERLSRRDRLTQLWLIEDAVRRDDIPGALKHYDIALRTSNALAPVLYPQLGVALEDAAIRKAFVPLIRTQPIWLKDFLLQQVREGKRLADLAQSLVAAGWRPKSPVDRNISRLLMVRLAEDAEFATLLRYSGSVGAGRTLATTTAFDRASLQPDFQPLTWQPTESAGVSAQFQRDDGAGQQLFVSADPGVSAVAVRKLLLLPNGSYQLAGAVRRAEAAQGGAGFWRLRCARGGAELWRGDGDGASRPVSVDGRCGGYWLELVVTGGGEAPYQGLSRAPQLRRNS